MTALKFARLKTRTDTLLGTRDERVEGKAAYESWAQARPIHDDDRSYAFGCLVQQAPRIAAPSAAFKLTTDAVLTQQQEAIKAFVHVSLTFAWWNLSDLRFRPAQTSPSALGSMRLPSC